VGRSLATWQHNRYVNAPIGAGKVPQGVRALKPHIACPTTAGTGSEITPIAIFDLLDQRTKTGIVRVPSGSTLA